MIYYYWAKRFEAAVSKLPKSAAPIFTGSSQEGYWQAVTERWGFDEMIFIEQDIVVHDEVFSQFENCYEPWCAFGYMHGTGTREESLGCTRISLELQERFSPDDALSSPFGTEVRVGCSFCSADSFCWRHVDGPFNWLFRQAGLQVHKHTPFVEHLYGTSY